MGQPAYFGLVLGLTPFSRKPAKKQAKPGRPLPGRSKKEKKAPTDAPAAAVAEEVASSGSRSSKRVIKK